MLLKMEDYSKQLADLQEEARQMAADCAHFSMDDVDFSQLDAISDDISATRVSTNMALLNAASMTTQILCIKCAFVAVHSYRLLRRFERESPQQTCMSVAYAPVACWQNAQGVGVLQTKCYEPEVKAHASV